MNHQAYSITLDILYYPVVITRDQCLNTKYHDALHKFTQKVQLEQVNIIKLLFKKIKAKICNILYLI